MTSQIVRFDGQDGIEILIDTTTGESFCSARGYARMSGKSKGTIYDRLKGGRFEEREMVEIPTSGGVQRGRLITEDMIVEWLPKDNPTAATALLKLGVRMGLHKMAGYEVSSTAVQSQQRPTIAPNYHQAAATADFMRNMVSGLVKAGVDPVLAEAHIMAQTAILHPDVAPAIEAAKLLVPQQSQLQSEDLLLNPTDIGKRMEPQVSARQVNLLLIGLGLQSRTNIKDQPYELTAKGLEFGKVTLNQAKASSKTVQHIKWKASVVDLLTEAA